MRDRLWMLFLIHLMGCLLYVCHPSIGTSLVTLPIHSKSNKKCPTSHFGKKCQIFASKSFSRFESSQMPNICAQFSNKAKNIPLEITKSWPGFGSKYSQILVKSTIKKGSKTSYQFLCLFDNLANLRPFYGKTFTAGGNPFRNVFWGQQPFISPNVFCGYFVRFSHFYVFLIFSAISLPIFSSFLALFKQHIKLHNLS